MSGTVADALRIVYSTTLYLGNGNKGRRAWTTTGMWLLEQRMEQLPVLVWPVAIEAW